MSQIEKIAADELKDVTFFREERDTRRYLAELSSHQRQELADYSDDELATQDLILLGRA